MMLLIKNIKQLVQVEEEARKWVAGKDMAFLNVLENAFLFIQNGKIADFGTMKQLKQEYMSGEVIDAAGKLVLPSYCDSHTHLVYAGSRELEYVDKIKGLSYQEIAKRGGGILNSSKLLHDTSEEELYRQSLSRIEEIIRQGTGAVEIKSGYGLNTRNELKMLKVIRRLKEETPLTIKSTFLGAHAVPAEYKNNQSGYVDLVIQEMLPAVAEEGLADFVDVFCDRGFFTLKETDRILSAASKYGLRPKIHANELDFSGGIQVGVKHNALSVDHLEYTGDEEIKCLLGSHTMPTLLPGASFFLGMINPPARKMMDAGLPLALASDFNPGSSPSGNMKMIMSFGCVDLRMTPEEVINAVTLNGAYAMGLEKELGSICRGKTANFFITKEVPNYQFLPYAYGSELIDTVILNGELEQGLGG
ncbi:MAG: imidazolonepropionase [Bacteroidota bacterium]|nr:imidazolonepropionase [Bacteroidota bacterium]